ncbi:hypothetical protein DMB66_28960 [Actinoplanes sp. ATCC 53533]|uniref:hypothetical protein n=1 Tax=Actinoplanes sp. ATCC 53533 TaxID=1288362 RepID=UPI000F7A1A68|nr:hypothetical protein [Actinoplanes sp. ATCC 53533]RSM58514.1 hypothetical protein DMB66_28960 [Actinoplanes sp. ATCC 53533]
MNHDRDLDGALRHAADPVPARVTREPVRELLDQIVRSDRRAAPLPAATRVPGRRPRLALAGALAAAVAAAVAVVNIGPAYASWTPDPAPLPAAEAQQIAARCVPAPEKGAVRVVIGEKRGDYAFVTALTPGWSRTCFRDHDASVRESSILAEPLSAEQLGAEGVELSSWGQLRTEEGYVRLLAGHLGSKVTAVDIVVRRAGGGHTRTVHATVRDGYFAAWYPEGIDESSSNSTALTLRLADGGTVGELSASELHDQAKVG